MGWGGVAGGAVHGLWAAQADPAFLPFCDWSQQESSPRRLCVLPFTNESGQPDVGGQVRRSFAGHLSIKRFRDVELHEIDSRLPSDWRQLPAQSLGEILGCHALVYGIVTQADRLYLGPVRRYRPGRRYSADRYPNRPDPG